MITTGLALGIILLAMVMVVRGLDVRLVLFLAALILGALGNNMAAIVREFLVTFSNEKFVIPICTAMGFAHVLRSTRCDEQLVRLLIQPLQKIKALLIPGVIIIGFIANSTIISQVSTAVCLGTVVVPILQKARISPVTTGAALLLGSSIGGELLNPGAPELLTIGSLTKKPSTTLIPYLLPLLLPLLLLALLLFSLQETIHPREHSEFQLPVQDLENDRDSTGNRTHLHWLKGVVPLIPILFLFVTSPTLHWVTIPGNWLGTPLPGGDPGKQDPGWNSRLIGLAMLLGVTCAVVASPGEMKTVMKTFFTGAGYGFTTSISLIVTATCFGKAIQLVVGDGLGELIAHNSRILQPLAGTLPALFATVSGSGMASTQSLYGFFYAPAIQLEEDPLALGALVSVAAAVGRTLSPVSAVTLMVAELTGTRPVQLIAALAVPLISSYLLVLILRLAGLV